LIESVEFRQSIGRQTVKYFYQFIIVVTQDLHLITAWLLDSAICYTAAFGVICGILLKTEKYNLFCLGLVTAACQVEEVGVGMTGFLLSCGLALIPVDLAQVPRNVFLRERAVEGTQTCSK
jgi:hypothetical protein